MMGLLLMVGGRDYVLLTVGITLRLLWDSRFHLIFVLSCTFRFLAQEPSAVVDSFSKKEIHFAAEIKVLIFAGLSANFNG